MLNLDLVMLKFDVGHRAGYWYAGIRAACSGVSIETFGGIHVAHWQRMR
jgi:hypothetical protein